MIPGSQCQQSVLHLDNATLKEEEMKGVEASPTSTDGWMETAI